MSQRKTESGNVIFLILIGIALLAALSFAVSDMMRQGDPSYISDQKADLYAGEILNYTRTIRQSIQHMMISNECLDTEISFENNVASGYVNGSAPSDNSCHVFETDGGGVVYVAPSSDWLDSTQSAKAVYGIWYMLGESCVYDIGTGTTDCATANTETDSELIVVLPWIKKTICEAINDELDISSTMPQISNKAWNNASAKFTGTYSQGGFAIQSDASSTVELQRKMSGCFEGNTFPETGSYHFYQVLVPR